MRELVASSGFPLQFAVAKRLLEQGYDVRPSARFLNRAKGRESEVDVVALKRQSRATTTGTPVDVTWRLIIEVKDSHFPFVLFGLAAEPSSEPGAIHPDSFYNHVQTTRDRGMRNRFGVAAVDGAFNGGWSRAQHHQLSAVPRLHLATTFERTNNGGTKLHLPEKLSSALATLGSYIDNVTEGWQAISKQPDVEKIGNGNLQIYLNFALLVHRGPHYRFTADTEDLTPSQMSSVFLTHSAEQVQVAYIVDFVSFEFLGDAVATIEATAEAMVRGLASTVLRSK